MYRPRAVVNADDWRLALGHRYNWFNEPIVHAHTKLAVRALLNKHDVLVDETNTTRSSIIQWLEEDIDAIPVFINTPLDVCKQRAIDSNQRDLLPVLDRMQSNLFKTFGMNLNILGTVHSLREEAKFNISMKRIVV